MIKEHFSFPSAAGGCEIEGVRFLPENGEVRGTLQLMHGMMEHIGRYDEMAEFFTERGWAVYGHSHLGHGHSSNERYPLGYFGRRNAGGRVFRADAKTVHDRAKRDFPNVPAVLFGYSMGSFVCRLCLADFGDELAAAAVCSTGNGDRALKFGIASTRMLSLFAGKRKAKLVDNVVNRGFNQRTGSDSHVAWLSDDLSYLLRDGKPDPLCGFLFSNRGYYDLMTMIRAMLREETFAKAPLDKWNGKGRNFEIKSEDCNNPCGDCRTDVRTKNNPDRLNKRQKAGVYKGYDHDRCCTGRLNHHCDEHTGEYGCKTVSRDKTEGSLHSLTRALLNTVAHQLHSVKKKAQTTN